MSIPTRFVGLDVHTELISIAIAEGREAPAVRKWSRGNRRAIAALVAMGDDIRSRHSDLTDRMIFLGEASLRRALREYDAHFHTERPHQGLGNELVTPAPHAGSPTELVEHERLGGILRHYHRAAA